MKKKGIILTFEGLPKTVLESQAVVHAKEVRPLGVDLEVWAFDVFQETYQQSVKNAEEMESKHGVPVKVFRGVRPAFPFSELINALLLCKQMLRGSHRIEVIRARGEYSTVVAGVLRLLGNFELVWDCRGDTYWETRERVVRGAWMRRMVAILYCQLIRAREMFAAFMSSRIIFVSDELQHQKLTNPGHRDTCILPCAAPEEFFFFDPELRRKVRQDLGYAEDDRVFVYSGSINYYQCFQEAVDLVTAYAKEDPKVCLLVLSPHEKIARHQLENYRMKRVEVRSARFSDVNGYLNAGDFGLFLRRDLPLNRVASPVKFAEYSLTGLSVIMADSVKQSYRLSKEFGNLVHYDWKTPPKLEDRSQEERKEISRRAAQALGRRSQFDLYRWIYSVSGSADVSCLPDHHR